MLSKTRSLQGRRTLGSGLLRRGRVREPRRRGEAGLQGGRGGARRQRGRTGRLRGAGRGGAVAPGGGGRRRPGGMDALEVHLQVRLALGAVRAVRAGKGGLARVDANVRTQVLVAVAAPERPAAHAAHHHRHGSRHHTAALQHNTTQLYLLQPCLLHKHKATPLMKRNQYKIIKVQLMAQLKWSFEK